MEIKHTLKEARSLTDPICPSGAAAECWGWSHGEPRRVREGCRVRRRRGLGFPCPSGTLVCGEVLVGPSEELTSLGFFLPEPVRKMVTFPCGVRVELRFHQLFSNLMYVCAKLQPPPAHVADTRLLLCQPTVSPLAEALVPFPSIPAGPLSLGQRREEGYGKPEGSQGLGKAEPTWKRIPFFATSGANNPLCKHLSECSFHMSLPPQPACVLLMPCKIDLVPVLMPLTSYSSDRFLACLIKLSHLIQLR